MGRPAGARNRRSDVVARLVQAQAGATPGEYLAALAMPSRERLELAGGDKAAAFEAHCVELARLQSGSRGRPSRKEIDAARAMALRCLEKLAEYVHPKQAAVAIDGDAPPLVLAFDMGAPAVADRAPKVIEAGAVALPPDIAQAQQNQGLIPFDAPPSYGAPSYGKPSP
jgi:hypothetical protein